MKVPVLILCILVAQCYAAKSGQFSLPWHKKSHEPSPTSAPRVPILHHHHAWRPWRHGRGGVNPVRVNPGRVNPVAAKPVAANPVAAKPVAANPVAAKPVAVIPAAGNPVVISRMRRQAETIDAQSDTQFAQPPSNRYESSTMDAAENEMPINADDELRSALPNNPTGSLNTILTMANQVNTAMSYVERIRKWLHDLAVRSGVCQGA